MIDFDALVLKPAGDIFQIAVVYTPAVSQPGVLPFPTFGVYSSQPVDVILQDDAIYSDQETKLEVRLADFAVYPMEGDFVTMADPRHLSSYGKQFWIGDLDEDGQGGGKLLLRLKNPPDVVNPFPGETAMSHYAITLQQAALARLKAEFGTTFKTYRQTPMLQVQPGDLPILAVHILRERRLPDGQGTQTMPKFIHDLTLGFSGAVNMETDQQDTIHALEQWMALIDDILLSDATFTKMAEAFTAMDRVGQYAKVGETTLFEIRVEMNLQFRSYFDPRIHDQFATLDIKTQFPDKEHADSGTPQLEQLYHIAAAKRANGSQPPPTDKE